MIWFQLYLLVPDTAVPGYYLAALEGLILMGSVRGAEAPLFHGRASRTADSSLRLAGASAPVGMTTRDGWCWIRLGLVQVKIKVKGSGRGRPLHTSTAPQLHTTLPHTIFVPFIRLHP